MARFLVRARPRGDSQESATAGWLVGARVKLVATSKSERDNYLDGEWQKASRECDYAMGQRAAGWLVRWWTAEALTGILEWSQTEYLLSWSLHGRKRSSG